ncbi:NACHT, LRR and PYD domains-containing protein 12-like [Hemitrygon akajei]|uniref:NACHT, LRR and PYD domains-containing protein 12-like n=1 Tax=Hemitrygon akajei TaxID=2704970 RepID=UPI003BF9E4E5
MIWMRLHKDYLTVRNVLKRILPGRSSREDDRDSGSKVPTQGQIESDVPMECGPAAEKEEKIQPRDSDVRDTDQDPGTGTSEATACQPRDGDVRDTDQDPGTSTSEATACRLGSSLNTELSSPQEGAEPEFTISDLLAQGEEYRLYQLTKFYRDRLKQAIEEKVERLGWMLTKEGHFSREENEKVTELTEKGNRPESSRLFLSLMLEKGSQARRAMWESFLMWRTELPKLDRILREIQELGPDPQEYMNIAQGLSELPTQLIDVQQKHKETLRAQTETLRVNTILMTEKVKVFQLADRYAELTVISTVRDRRLVEHELLARGRDHEDYREEQLRRQLEKIRTDQLFQSSFSRSKFKSGSSAAVAGVPGIGKTTMVQKIVYDWAMGKIYQQFQFVFSFKFRDLNTINCRINLRELILDQYPYFGNFLSEVWKNAEGLLFIFDGLDEFKHKIDFADSRRETDPKYQCPDPEWWCEVSDIVYSLIQDGDLINYNLQPSQFLSGFLMELLQREDSAQSVVYTFPHLTIQEFVAAVAQFLNPHPGDILKFFTDAHSTADGRFEVFLRFVAGLSSPMTARGLEEFLGPFPHETICRVIDWVKEEVKRKSGNTGSKAGKRSLLNTLHYLFESQNRGLAQDTLGSVETLSFRGMTLTPIDCAVLSHVIGLCDTIKHLNLRKCHIQCEGIQRLGPGLHKCQELRLNDNKLGDSGVKLVSAALTNPECEIQKLRLRGVGLTDSGAKDLASALSTNPSLTDLDLSYNELEDSGVKLVSAALRNPECKIQKLWLTRVGLTDSGAEDLVSALSTNRSLTELDLSNNKLGDSGVKLVSAALRNPECKIQKLWLTRVGLTDSGAEDLVSALSTKPSLTELDLSDNKLGDSGVKLVSVALRNPECTIQKLGLYNVGLTDSGAADLVSALSTNPSLTGLNLRSNSLTDRSVPALRRLILTLPSLKLIELTGNQFSETGRKELKPLQGFRPGLRVDLNI